MNPTSKLYSPENLSSGQRTMLKLIKVALYLKLLLFYDLKKSGNFKFWATFMSLSVILRPVLRFSGLYHIRQMFLRITSLSSIHTQVNQSISQGAYIHTYVVCICLNGFWSQFLHFETIWIFKYKEEVKRSHDFRPVVFFIDFRKYPLYRYILGVQTHTTAWDQHLGGNETMKRDLII